jgi:hypothetical protein
LGLGARREVEKRREHEQVAMEPRGRIWGRDEALSADREEGGGDKAK